MTPDQLRDRALGHLPGGRAKFGPLAILILGAMLSVVIERYFNRLLDKCESRSIRSPNWIERWKLRRAVRAACSDPRVQAMIHRESGETAYSPSHLDTAYGDDAYQALLAMAATLTDKDLDSIIHR